MRSIVELVSSFFGSLNVDSEKIIRIEEEKGNYKVPLHEFTKHALLGEYAHYNPQSSLYASNVYDISSSDQKEHFLCPLIISFLRNSTGRQDRDGFVAGDHLIHEMLKVGFTEDQTCHALRKMAENRLIETPHSHFREIEASEATSPSEFPFRVTSIGVYHVQNWMCTFSYLDAVSIDTPIFDPSVRGLLHELAGSFAIEHRLERSINFLAYLESAWEDCAIDVSYFNFLETRNLQASSFDPVKKFVAKRNR